MTHSQWLSFMNQDRDVELFGILFFTNFSMAKIGSDVLPLDVVKEVGADRSLADEFDWMLLFEIFPTLTVRAVIRWRWSASVGDDRWLELWTWWPSMTSGDVSRDPCELLQFEFNGTGWNQPVIIGLNSMNSRKNQEPYPGDRGCPDRGWPDQLRTGGPDNPAGYPTLISSIWSISTSITGDSHLTIFDGPGEPLKWTLKNECASVAKIHFLKNMVLDFDKLKSPFLVYELLWRFRLRSRGISPSNRLIDLGEPAISVLVSRMTEVRLALPLGVPSEEAFDRGDNSLVFKTFDWSRSSDFSSVDWEFSSFWICWRAAAWA